MGWLDNLIGKTEEPKKTKKTQSKTKKIVKKETKAVEKKKAVKKDLVLKGPEKKTKTVIKTQNFWTKGKLDKLSTSELHKVAKENGVSVQGLTKTQIYRKIVK